MRAASFHSSAGKPQCHTVTSDSWAIAYFVGLRCTKSLTENAFATPPWKTTGCESPFQDVDAARILTGRKPLLCIDKLSDKDVEAKLEGDEEKYKGLE